MPSMLVVQNICVARFPTPAVAAPSLRSWAGLCLASFFLAEMHGVTMPFVNTYLMECGWRFDAIGGVAALAGLVSLMINSPAGFLVDHVRRRRELMAAASLLVGSCFGLLPLVPASYVWIGALLVAAAVLNPLFGPLTNALTLGLIGHPRLNRALGVTQSWDHAGNIFAALTAMTLVRFFPVASVFFAIAAASVLSATAVFFIRPSELLRGRERPKVQARGAGPRSAFENYSTTDVWPCCWHRRRCSISPMPR